MFQYFNKIVLSYRDYNFTVSILYRTWWHKSTACAIASVVARATSHSMLAMF